MPAFRQQVAKVVCNQMAVSIVRKVWVVYICLCVHPDEPGLCPQQLMQMKRKTNKTWHKLSLQTASPNYGRPGQLRPSTRLWVELESNDAAGWVCFRSDARTAHDPILKRGTSNCLIIRPATRTRPTFQTLPAGQTPLEHPTLQVARMRRLRSVPRTLQAPRRPRHRPRLRLRRSLLKRGTSALTRAIHGFGSS